MKAVSALLKTFCVSLAPDDSFKSVDLDETNCVDVIWL